MTGPEHYKRAEKYLDSASEARLGSEEERFAFNLAKVHAMLALTAAVVGLDAIEGPGGGSATGRTAEDANAWDDVLLGGK